MLVENKKTIAIASIFFSMAMTTKKEHDFDFECGNPREIQANPVEVSKQE